VLDRPRAFARGRSIGRNATGSPNWGPALEPNTIYITDSPGPTSHIIRYTINKDIQDSYSNFGVLPDGTVSQYSFASRRRSCPTAAWSWVTIRRPVRRPSTGTFTGFRPVLPPM